MNELAARLHALGEHYAAGFCEASARSRFYRYALAQARFLETVPLPAYDGGLLYPCGVLKAPGAAVQPSYSHTFQADLAALARKDEEGARVFEAEIALFPGICGPHTVGGNLFTHSIPNYGRVAREGLAAYALRIERLPADDFQDGLRALRAGIEALHARVLAHLRAARARKELLEALSVVPFAPARSLYEALVCWNFIYYLDGCDNPGRLDADLIEYDRCEDAQPWLREFFLHVDENDGWSAALGPDYNRLTLSCLRAIRGLRRPSLELRVTRGMPEELWQAAAESLATGCGQPALYGEENYQRALAERFPEIPEADRLRFNGGGCTETMLAGISNVGSLDAGLNLPLILADSLREDLAAAKDFEDFYGRLMARTREVIAGVLDQVNAQRALRARYRPQPVRTLLIDDCLDRGRDFCDGGARWTFSVVNCAGLINVADSLLAIRYALYDERLADARALTEGLAAGDASLRALLARAPHFGVDDEKADALAARYVNDVCDAFDQRACYPAGRFLPSSIQFVAYAQAGAQVPATPDGRAAGAPLNDSVGALQGRDVLGPTALLNSVSRLPLSRLTGTPVMNLRLAREHLCKALRPLARAFFERGGMQLQITCQSKADLLAALERPAEYGHLIVRIGGYAEYFNRLSAALKQTVLERTEH